MKKNKLSKLFKALSPDKTSVDFSEFDSQVNELKNKLREKIEIKTIDDVSIQLERFKKKLDLTPLTNSVDGIRDSFQSVSEYLYEQIEQKTSDLEEMLARGDKRSLADADNIKGILKSLDLNIKDLDKAKTTQLASLFKEIEEAKKIESKLNLVINETTRSLKEEAKILASSGKVETEKSLREMEVKLEALRREIFTRIASLGNDLGRGGAMNRQMFIGGLDPLTRYTDVNLKAGNGTTITYVNNNTTKKVDITITATGSGSGITREVNSVAVDTAAGSTGGVDYVYLCSDTLTLTLPTAVGNSNLYTVKNVGTGVVTIATTGGQTIDTEVNAQLAVRYTSVDLISDTANWNVT